MDTSIDTITNKREEFEFRVKQSCPDIIGLTEINPKNAKYTIIQQDLNMDCYKRYFNTDGRGVALYVKEELESVKLELQNKGASVWCEVPLLNYDRLIVGVVYRSPNSSNIENDQILKLIHSIVDRKTSHAVIFGDFNYPEIIWSNQTVEAPSWSAFKTAFCINT